MQSSVQAVALAASKIISEPFLLGGFALALALAFVAGPLGCFVVWRRMAFFGDALAHAAVLGVAVALILEVEPVVLAAVFAAGAALLVPVLERRTNLPRDTLLGALAHGALALAVVLTFSFAQTSGAALHGFFFGEIFAAPSRELAFSLTALGLAFVALVLAWNPLLRITLSPELARAEGVKIKLVEVVLALTTAVAVAAAMRVVGLLLTASLLVLPAATAQAYARSPHAMAVLAAVCAIIAVVAGFVVALAFDLPGGPSVALASLILFVVSLLRRRAR